MNKNLLVYKIIMGIISLLLLCSAVSAFWTICLDDLTLTYVSFDWYVYTFTQYILIALFSITLLVLLFVKTVSLKWLVILFAINIVFVVVPFIWKPEMLAN